MAKIKVAFVTATTRKGGAERMLFNIMSSLDERHDIRLYVTSCDQVPAWVSQQFSTIQFYKKHARAAFGKLLWHLRCYAPDYVFTTSSNIGYLLLVCRWMLHAKFKVILRCAVSPSEIYHSSIKHKLLAGVNRLMYEQSDLMIAQTEFMKSDLMRAYGVDADKIRVIRNIIDKNFVSQSLAQGTAVALPDGFNFIASGMLYSVKGFDILIEAIAPVIQQNRKVFLSILGEERYEAGYRAFLQEKINSLGLTDNVRLLGYQENPFPYYQAADVFVMSSRKEGFPNVVLEALYLKKPVIATNCVDFAGVIVDGTNGFVVEKENVQALREALQKAVSYRFDMDAVQIDNFDYNKLFV